MCKYPFGSGGNLNFSADLSIPFARSSSMICSKKLRDFLISDIRSFDERQNYGKLLRKKAKINNLDPKEQLEFTS